MPPGSDPDLSRDFAGPLRAARSTGPATAACLDDDVIAALAEGTIPPAARAAAVPHLARCERCRAAVASVARLLADPELAGELGRQGVTGVRRLRRWSLPAAAAAAVVLVMARLPEPEPEPHRNRAIVTAGTPAPFAPIGVVAEAAALRWSPVSGASGYRVTLYDQDSRVLLDLEVPDTVVSLPDTVALRAGRTYLWRVEASVGFGRWAASDLVEFTVAGPRR